MINMWLLFLVPSAFILAGALIQYIASECLQDKRTTIVTTVIDPKGNPVMVIRQMLHNGKWVVLDMYFQVLYDRLSKEVSVGCWTGSLLEFYNKIHERERHTLAKNYYLFQYTDRMKQSGILA